MLRRRLAAPERRTLRPPRRAVGVRGGGGAGGAPGRPGGSAEVIAAHLAWKREFEAAVAGRGELDVKLALDHRGCRVGQWLEAEQPRLAAHPLYEEAQLWHRRFHAAAAAVAACALSGRSWEAVRLLDASSYRATSESLVSALEELTGEAR